MGQYPKIYTKIFHNIIGYYYFLQHIIHKYTYIYINGEEWGKGPGKMVKNVYESNSILTEGKRGRGVTYFIGKYIPHNNYYCQIQRQNIIM